MTNTDFYRLGRQYAFRPQSEYMYDDLPLEMSHEEKTEFNRGYSDCMREQRAANRTLAVLCVLTVVACFVLWWMQ